MTTNLLYLLIILSVFVHLLVHNILNSLDFFLYLVARFFISADISTLMLQELKKDVTTFTQSQLIASGIPRRYLGFVVGVTTGVCIYASGVGCVKMLFVLGHSSVSLMRKD
jgi:hypothetical protein